MNMLHRYRRVLFLAVLTFLMAGAVTTATAQDRYGFPPGVSHEIVRRIAKSAEDRSDDFKRELRRMLDNSSLSGSLRESRLNDRARRLERALDRVRKGVIKRKNFYQVQSDVREAVSAGRDINFTVSNRWRGSSLEREWRRLRNEINALARTVRVGQI